MTIELRLPDIKGSDEEQLRQIRSYLYQLVNELRFALNDLDERVEELNRVQDRSRNAE
jgi:hypothetical protein